MIDVSTLELRDGDVLVLRTDEPPMASDMDEVSKRLPAGTLMIILKPGESLESLNDDEMAAHGWVRK